jgi:flagellar biosynthesis protein FlhB
MADDRTEAPTQKKLKEAHDRGQVARSRDLAVAVATLMGVVVLGRIGGSLMNGLGERLAGDLSHFGDYPLRSISPGDLHAVIVSGGQLIAVLVGPIAIATAFVGVLVQGLQGGWTFAPTALQPSLGRLNPISGFKRFGLMQAGADTLKTYVAVVVIAYLTWSTIEAVLGDSTRFAWMSPLAAARAGWNHTESLLWKVTWGLLLLSIADYGLQWYRHMHGLRMTKQEIRQESKDSEGSAEVKGKVRRIQRDMARRRMIADVKRATVVITNPTHFAVALEYKRGAMAAPLVLAKGADHLAAAIREQAQKYGIPMVENKPLAQALYKTAEVGESIPANLFAAVAEVLAQLVRLKRLAL